MTNVTTTGWNAAPPDPARIMDILLRLKAEWEARKGRDGIVDVLVMLREDANRCRAQIQATFGSTAGPYGFPDAIGGIRVRVVDSVEEGRGLAILLARDGNRVGLVGRLNVEPAAEADTPVHTTAATPR